MAFFKKIFGYFIIAVLALGGLFAFRTQASPCNRTLKYSIGQVDPRFEIGKDKLAAEIESMAKLWDGAASGKELFAYDENAAFKINLIFDERQQRTIDERNLRKTIDLSENSYQSLVDQHNALSYQHKQDLSDYDQKRVQYETDLAQFNAEVQKWNRQGGAPAAEYKLLNQRKAELVAVSNQLEAQRLSINSQTNDLNTLAAKINEMAKSLNLNVDNYNGRFGEARKFDQGMYTGKEIDIYQFNDESDLKLVLAHELGHALSLEHVDDPKAVMYYLMDQQNLANLQLTDTDKAALLKECKVLLW
ncbi:MAG: matrixin family metalloprotease [Acidobacteriaceae bacterium]